MDLLLSNERKHILEEQYGIGEIVDYYRLEGGWWNEVIAIHTDRQKYVLRISHRTTKIESLSYEHSLNKFMSQRIVEVPAPLALQDGSTFFVYEGRIVSLYPFMIGNIPDVNRASTRCAAAKMLAQLHLAALEFPGNEANPGHKSLAELNWDSNLMWDWQTVKQYMEIEMEMELNAKERKSTSNWNSKQLEQLAEIRDRRKEIEQQKELISEWVYRLTASDRPLLFAPTHGDYYKGNLLFANDKVTAVIDWDDCRPDWLSYELARATWEFCKDSNRHDLHREYAIEFVHAYKMAGGPVGSDEYELLLPFMRCVRLMEVLFHLGQASQGEEWDPDYTLHNLNSLLNLYHTEDLELGRE